MAGHKLKKNRRQALKLGLGAMGGAAFSSAIPFQKALSQADETKFLFVITATGGGNIIDSFLPILESESGNANLNTYSAAQIFQPNGSNIRCVRKLDNRLGSLPIGSTADGMVDLLSNHYQDMAVLCHEVSSVNHEVAQRRAITGDNVNGNKTIMEAVAEKYGSQLMLPNCNMATAGYTFTGGSKSLASYALSQKITDPVLFPFATHSSKGLKNLPNESMISHARSIREKMEASSAYMQRFSKADLIKKYLELRGSVKAIEEANLIDKLIIVPNAPSAAPIEEYGLKTSESFNELLQYFPNMLSDELQSQAALGFLLAKHNVSSSITIGLNFNIELQGTRLLSPPLAFDYSHTDHRAAQNSMWARISSVADGLIRLLKNTDYKDNPALGKLWDRSLVYIASDFGRDKEIPQSGGSGHHVNNGSVLISPLLNGNRVYGGVNTQNGITDGFDPSTGTRTVNSNALREEHVYSTIAQAMGVSFSKRTDMKAVVKA